MASAAANETNIITMTITMTITATYCYYYDSGNTNAVESLLFRT